MTDKKDKPDAKPKQHMTGAAKRTIKKPATLPASMTKESSGLDWDKIKADFEKLYDPAKGAQLAGKQIARIVVKAIIELAKDKK